MVLGRLGVLNTFVTGYFQFTMDLSRCNLIVNQRRSVNENDLCAIFTDISKGKNE